MMSSGRAGSAAVERAVKKQAYSAPVPMARILKCRYSAMTTQKVVIVNGSAEMLGLLDGALGAGHYDVVLVESNEHAYSRIKRAQPDLVILCTHIEEPDGFRVLSMLKLDDETRKIPVLTYTTDEKGEESDDNLTEPSDVALFAPQPAARMN